MKMMDLRFIEQDSKPIKPGVDIVEISRVNTLLKIWGDRFLNRVFTHREQAYCLNKASYAAHLAARFAAKEAVIKSFGCRPAPPLKSIEIVKNTEGKPEVVLHNSAGVIAEEMGVRCVELSLSHSRLFAVAFVITRC